MTLAALLRSPKRAWGPILVALAGAEVAGDLVAEADTQMYGAKRRRAVALEVPERPSSVVPERRHHEVLAG